jgi:hypothetical protein
MLRNYRTEVTEELIYKYIVSYVTVVTTRNGPP